MRKKYLFFLTAVIALGVPLLAFAALVPCGVSTASTGQSTSACTLCDLYVLAQNIMKFLMWQATPIIAIFAFSWAGFKILISGPNPGLRSEGFGIMKKTLVGILIVFSSWIIINEVLLFFSQPGTPVTCNPNTLTCPNSAMCPANGQCPATVLSNPWNAVNCNLPSAAAGAVIGTFTNADSPQLTALIACVSAAVSAQGYTLRTTSGTPNTDSNIAKGLCNPMDPNSTFTCTGTGCNAPGSCQHAQYSCHYGGHTCTSIGSFAFDFGTGQPTDPPYATTEAAAYVCKADYVKQEANGSGHASIGNSGNCGCN